MDAERYFIEFDKHLMEDTKPSEYFNALMGRNAFPTVHSFNMLADLKNIPQSPVHHPEGNVWNHTMLVVDHAAQRRGLSLEPRIFMWAALLHDLGKLTNTKVRNGKVTAYEHDAAGEKLARSFLMQCTQDKGFIDKVCVLVRWHMQLLYVINHLPFADIEQMMSQADVNEVALLGFCDRLGRGDLSPEETEAELKNIDFFIKKCEHLNPRKR